MVIVLELVWMLMGDEIKDESSLIFNRRGFVDVVVVDRDKIFGVLRELEES